MRNEESNIGRSAEDTNMTQETNTPASTPSDTKSRFAFLHSSILVNICRFVVALTFIFSGYVKAIDPLGTQYKIEDYLEALSLQSLLPDWATLGTSVILSAIEFCCGIFLLLAISRRVTSRVTLCFMVMMTAITRRKPLLKASLNGRLPRKAS